MTTTSTRTLLACVLLVTSVLGCASGYVTYFEPEAKHAPAAFHRDPYMHPAPPSAVALDAGSISLGCTNLRKFVLLPLPWFRRGFRPSELEIELIFSPEPSTVQLDLGSVALELAGDVVLPSRIAYEGRRPPPDYSENVALPIGGRVTLVSPALLTFSFPADARDASEFRMSLGELSVDGARVSVPPLAFSREGRFVVYRNPEKASRRPANEDPLDAL